MAGIIFPNNYAQIPLSFALEIISSVEDSDTDNLPNALDNSDTLREFLKSPVDTLSQFLGKTRLDILAVNHGDIKNTTRPPRFHNNNIQPEIVRIIKTCLNALTANNAAQTADKIKYEISSKCGNKDLLSESSNIIFETMLVNFANKAARPGYMLILNNISNMGIVMPNGERHTIRGFFLLRCKSGIMKYTSDAHIQLLATYDADNSNSDLRDKYHEERDKIVNLIAIICAMYQESRQGRIAQAYLGADVLFGLLYGLVEKASNVVQEIQKLGDTNAEDFLDLHLDNYEFLTQTLAIYVDGILAYLENGCIAFREDITTYNVTKNVSGNFKNLINKIATHIVVNLRPTMKGLQNRFQNLNLTKSETTPATNKAKARSKNRK